MHMLGYCKKIVKMQNFRCCDGKHKILFRVVGCLFHLSLLSSMPLSLVSLFLLLQGKKKTGASQNILIVSPLLGFLFSLVCTSKCYSPRNPQLSGLKTSILKSNSFFHLVFLFSFLPLSHPVSCLLHPHRSQQTEPSARNAISTKS